MKNIVDWTCFACSFESTPSQTLNGLFMAVVLDPKHVSEGLRSHVKKTMAHGRVDEAMENAGLVRWW